MSFMFSSVELNAGSVTAKFRDRLRNFIKWMTAFNSFLRALGFKLTWKNICK